MAFRGTWESRSWRTEPRGRSTSRTSTSGSRRRGSSSATRQRPARQANGSCRQKASNKYLAQVDADNTRSRFPVAVLCDVTAADVDLSVRFKPVSGRVDQAAGLVWRYQNEDNYYIVRANALEDNVVLYKVENGKRTDLPAQRRRPHLRQEG